MQVSEPQLAIGMPFITLRTIWIEEAKEETSFLNQNTLENRVLLFMYSNILKKGYFAENTHSYTYVH